MFEQARANGLSDAMLDCLALTPARLKAIADDVRQVCNLADPVRRMIDGGLLDSGLRLGVVASRWSVIGVIYERAQTSPLTLPPACITGNAAILRGGKETYRTNAIPVAVIKRGAGSLRFTRGCRTVD